MFYRNAGYFIFKKSCHIIKWVKFAVSCKLFMLCCGSSNGLMLLNIKEEYTEIFLSS